MPPKDMIELQMEIADVRKDIAVIQERQEYIIDLLKGNGGLMARVDSLQTEIILAKGNKLGRKELWTMIGAGTILNIVVMAWSVFGK